MNALSSRVAGAPITWGVCEVPGWGHQLSSDRVLREAAAVGLRAVELGPPGFLPDEPAAVRRLLERHGLRLAAGFVALVLHREDESERSMAAAEASARVLAGAGADVLVVAAETGRTGYEASSQASDEEWATLVANLDRVRGIAEEAGLVPALHPHFGTLVESADQIQRVLDTGAIPLCIDTGHLLVGGADPLEVTRAAGGRVAHLHLKDVDAALAARVRRREIGYREAVARGLYRPLGEGDVDIAGVVAHLAGTGYDGWYVLEQDAVLDGEPAEGDGPAADAARSLRQLLVGAS
jgi:inosose dehydratase